MATLKQLSVFAENKPGKLQKITQALAEAGINILAINISSMGDFGVIKFIVNKSDEALQTLKSRGFTASLNEVLGIELQDRPGGLYEVVRVLGKHNVNVENAYIFVADSRQRSFLIVEVDDVQATRKTLQGENLVFYS